MRLLRCIDVQALSFFPSIGFDKPLIFGESFSGFGCASGMSVGLAQLKVGGVVVRNKLSGGLQTLDGSVGVSLLQESAAEFEIG